MAKLVVVMALLLPFLAACNDSRPSANGRQWEVVKSPITGRCYEVLFWTDGDGHASHGFGGMAEVSCDLLVKGAR